MIFIECSLCGEHGPRTNTQIVLRSPAPLNARMLWCIADAEYVDSFPMFSVFVARAVAAVCLQSHIPFFMISLHLNSSPEHNTKTVVVARFVVGGVACFGFFPCSPRECNNPFTPTHTHTHKHIRAAQLDTTQTYTLQTEINRATTTNYTHTHSIQNRTFFFRGRRFPIYTALFGRRRGKKCPKREIEI